MSLRKRERIKESYNHLSKEQVSELLEDKTTYKDTFFVPLRARWNDTWTEIITNEKMNKKKFFIRL